MFMVLNEYDAKDIRQEKTTFRDLENTTVILTYSNVSSVLIEADEDTGRYFVLPSSTVVGLGWFRTCLIQRHSSTRRRRETTPAVTATVTTGKEETSRKQTANQIMYH